MSLINDSTETAKHVLDNLLAGSAVRPLHSNHFIQFTYLKPTSGEESRCNSGQV